MEKIILGFLMIRGMTIYEIKTNINTKLEAMCSSSSGSIHSAINKLLQAELISFEEEGNKKIYYITASGRYVFEDWIHQPMQIDKHKDMELSKIFFGGLTNPKKRRILLEQFIQDMKENLNKLEMIRNASEFGENNIQEITQALFSDKMRNREGICKTLYGRTAEQTTSDIYTYQMKILEYGIDSTKFSINWYQKLLEEL